MSESTPSTVSGETESRESVFGILGEFRSPESLFQACEQLRDAGFRDWDAHTPFPVHGLDQAMGLKRSPVSLFVLVMGLGGAALGMLMQWWVATTAYPLVISGKPFFSWPAFIPITFECGVLGGASGAILGMLLLARLPRHHHSLFNSERFERVTDDAFFISVEATDPKFDREETKSLLERLGAIAVEEVAAGGRPAA
jgi:Alternative complex III, ActD subunit